MNIGYVGSLQGYVDLRTGHVYTVAVEGSRVMDGEEVWTGLAKEDA